MEYYITIADFEHSHEEVVDKMISVAEKYEFELFTRTPYVHMDKIGYSELIWDKIKGDFKEICPDCELSISYEDGLDDAGELYNTVESETLNVEF